MKHLLCVFIILVASGSTYPQVDLCIDAGHGGTDPGRGGPQLGAC